MYDSLPRDMAFQRAICIDNHKTSYHASLSMQNVEPDSSPISHSQPQATLNYPIFFTIVIPQGLNLITLFPTAIPMATATNISKSLGYIRLEVFLEFLRFSLFKKKKTLYFQRETLQTLMTCIKHILTSGASTIDM